MEEIKQNVKDIYNAIDEKKAIEPTIIEVNHVTPMADYFIVASASNINQLDALKDEVDRIMHEKGILPKRIEGIKTSSWILMDYGDIIVHLFTEEGRDFYDIERVWRDGTVVAIEEL